MKVNGDACVGNIMENITEIWAVGGGKGGTGKSFLICNIATSLAKRGKKVVLIDVDFGGANLHSFFGISKQAKNLSDFFEKKAPLDELINECDIINLGVIVGPISSFQPDSIKYFQKVKLFNHIKKIDADIVLLDLGAGIHFNIIDSFLLADKKIVVTVPQITAVENMYTFLKNAFLRKLTRAFIDHKIKYIIDDAVKNKQKYKLGSIIRFVDFLKTRSDIAKDVVESELSAYCVHIIINQTRTNKDIVLGNSIKSVCVKYLGFKTKCVGYVEYDDTIPLSSNKQQVYLQAYPKSKCTAKIERITDNLLKDKQMRVVL